MTIFIGLWIIQIISSLFKFLIFLNWFFKVNFTFSFLKELSFTLTYIWRIIRSIWTPLKTILIGRHFKIQRTINLINFIFINFFTTFINELLLQQFFKRFKVYLKRSIFNTLHIIKVTIVLLVTIINFISYIFLV